MLNKILFVTDLDGTLLSHRDIILDENVENLKNFRKRNGYIAVATGRPLNKIEFLKDDYGLEFDAITVLNGALIYVDNELKLGSYLNCSDNSDLLGISIELDYIVEI